jgi:hypothetical protein
MIYVENMSLHRIFGDKTSNEEFSGVKLETGHLTIFGFPIYIHVHVEKRTKLKPLGKKCIFVGYINTSKYYRIFILVKRKTIVIRYVNF